MDNTYQFGMIGLGVMGRNFLLNMADRGYKVIGLIKITRKQPPWKRPPQQVPPLKA